MGSARMSLSLSRRVGAWRRLVPRGLCARRTCLRGWGCEAGDTAFVVGAGSLFWTLLCPACYFLYRRAQLRSRMRHGIHWFLMLVCFPLWLAWFAYCVVTLVQGKTPAFRCGVLSERSRLLRHC